MHEAFFYFFGKKQIPDTKRNIKKFSNPMHRKTNANPEEAMDRHVNKNILITGAAGFIGSHVAEKLLTHGYNVLGIDNFDSFYSKEIKLKNLNALLTNNRFQFETVDICDIQPLSDIFSRNQFDAVIHLAAKAGVRPSIQHPTDYYKVNVAGTLNILEGIKNQNRRKLIFASSSSVYGNNKKTPFSETDNVDHPISPYAATKKAGELLVHTYHHLYNIDAINLRFFTVYGPRQRPDLAIHKFFNLLYNNKPIDVYGDGSTGRDYTYIEDIVQGIESSFHYLEQHENVNEIINLGNSSPVKLAELIGTIENVTQKQFIKKYLPMQEGDVDLTFADIEKTKKLLNYQPGTTLQDGLKKFKTWFENQIEIKS
jgi:UDP-glucuronate 4-epimerase